MLNIIHNISYILLRNTHNNSKKYIIYKISKKTLDKITEYKSVDVGHVSMM